MTTTADAGVGGCFSEVSKAMETACQGNIRCAMCSVVVLETGK